jgi:hypothetical protein
MDSNTGGKKGKWITGVKSHFLDELIKDCIYYGLGDDESLRYIEIRFKESITKTLLWTRKARIRSEESGTLWLSYFTRVGFLLQHKKLLELTERLIDTSMNQLFHESEKPYVIMDRDPNEDGSYELKDDMKILKLRSDVRESIKLYRELMLDSPVVAQVKKEIESNGKLRVKLLTEYGIDTDDDGNIIEDRNKFVPSPLGNKADQERDPEAVF